MPPLLLPSPPSYDPFKYMRGLVIDKKRGNLLKLDRHKYVKVIDLALGPPIPTVFS